MQERSQSPYQKLADLEEKINRAKNYIQQLQQENHQFQRKASWVEPRKSPSRKKADDFSLVRLEKATPRRKRRSSRYRDIDNSSYLRNRRSRRNWTKSSQLRIVVLILAVLTILWIIISAISSVVQLINRSTANFTKQNTELLKQLPTTPLLPPDIPAGSNAIALPTPINPSLQENELVYNVTTPPDLKPSQQLQGIVDEMVQLIQANRLPTEPLSITLINVKTGETAGYQQKLLKYPASVVKMFWMVNVFDQMHQGILPNEPLYGADLNRMIQQSSNDAASRLVDVATSTDSGYNLLG